ncbi:MAG: hypothetical protein AVDCRST_MAG42-1317 [uncultured Chthoniobacterales bacterium]|uniref:DUF4198 domain-containing protein n=1 Tax=uncultured Chthoniobacterales bacterium TaxID=1836801 RepID=A0A6J4HXD5_9BACT|nr:MAG: hypothetical protein AVDCRST_MAG42-1317 [uncultured Chthoniobacterales bacterium]
MTRLFVFFSSIALCVTCSAHDTWLVPSSYSAKPGETITFDLTSGMEFPKLDAAIKSERVHQARFRLGTEEGELKDFNPAEHALRLERAFAKDGTATLWLQLKAKDIELSDEDVAHYLEEIRAPEEVQRKWAEQKGQTKWKELYTKCAKTFVAVGNSAADRSWAEPVGLLLELVPLTDPAALRVGQPAKFKLLRNAKSLPATAVALHVEGDSGPRYQSTDAEGVVTFPLEMEGPSMLATVHLTPPAAGKPWESEFSTVTFEVKAK